MAQPSGGNYSTKRVWYSRGSHMENPLLNLSQKVPFDLIKPEHIEPAVRELLSLANANLETIENRTGPATYASTLGALEAATERLEFAMSVVEHLESVATTDALREAYNSILPDVSAFWS